MNNRRNSPLEMSKSEFREIGYRLIDSISDFVDGIHERPVTRGESPKQLQDILGNASLPESGSSPAELLSRATDLLLNHSLLNGHPKFFGYITSSAAPVAALADLLAASINPNVGAQILSPIATEIEKQTIRWLAEFIGVSPSYGGILVSGGNMANFTGFLAGKTAKTSSIIKEQALAGVSSKLLIYCSKATHTWVEKAANLFGLGSGAIRWIQTDAANKLDQELLVKTIQSDLENGYQPMMIIGNAGDVSTGVVDDLKAIAAVCKSFNLWFHIDGAYGVPAAVIPEMKHLFEGMVEADSIAMDPHKWLYSPVEAGCILVKDSRHLHDTFSSRPEYYNFDSTEEDPVLNYYEYGLQNSRGFRALKVWLILQQVGRAGYIKMIGEDIELSELLFDLAAIHPELEAVSQNLSICTLRYIPAVPGYDISMQEYLNELNKLLLDRLQQGGQVFLSNAVVKGKYCLRACIVNFRTSKKDIEEVIEIIVREGRDLDLQMRSKT